RKQRFPHAHGGFKFFGLHAVINHVAAPLASERIGYSIDQRVARLLSLLEILETKGGPHAESGGSNIMMAFVELFGAHTHVGSRMRIGLMQRRLGVLIVEVFNN